MKHLLLTLLLLLLPLGLAAQNTIKGTLIDGATGESMPFVNVMLEGAKHGATTDINGYFVINRVPDGTYTLVVRFTGYKEYRESLTLQSKQTLTKNIRLESATTVLNDVVITGNRVQERRANASVSVEKISAAQIQQMPSVGGQSDLAQYLQVLPGVNSTGDQGGQLYVRGGSMIQNLTLLDGMVVYNPFHSIGLYSIFETDVILNADIYTGGFGAEYGGRLSSVMDISTRDGNKKHHTGKVGLNTFGASLIAEGPLKRETAKTPSTITYLLTAKNSYLSRSSHIFYPYIEGGLPFDFTDLYGKLSFNSGTGSKINFFGFRFDDKVLGYQDIADYQWLNYGAGSNFVIVTGNSSILDGSFAYSYYRDSLSDASGKPKFSDIGGFNANINVTNYFGASKLKFGMCLEGYSTQYHYYNIHRVQQKQDEHTSNFSLYGTYHAKLDNLILDPGVRVIHYGTIGELSIEPRLAAKWTVHDDVRLKFAGGYYSQLITDTRSDYDIVNLFNGFLIGNGSLHHPTTFRGEDISSSTLQHAIHFVAGVEYDLIEHLIINLEGYYKRFDHLLNLNRNQMYDPSDPAYQTGGVFEKPQYLLTDFIIEEGDAKGIDVSLCYELERLYLWATYSLGFVSRTDEISTYTPHYDRRHTVNLLATYSLGEEHQWELSGRWSFGSGFPFTPTQGIYENLGFNGGIASNYWTENGSFGVHYAEAYSSRLPNYHRLDIGIKRRFSIGPRSILDVNLSATNAYNRNNIFYFDRITFSRVDQLPILVSLGLNLTF
ncbi:MAG: TonB-dependent receptor [Bacteroidales bacterium]|nr:TonB-dependent receptor [Bacteroidales bacterium]